MRDYFSGILDADETVLAYYKPVRRKFFAAAVMTW